LNAFSVSPSLINDTKKCPVVPFLQEKGIIASRFPNETMSFGPQMFIVKSLIISNTENHPIYIKTERRQKGLATGETERERVCERQRVAENGGRVGRKNGRWRNGPFWDNLVS